MFLSSNNHNNGAKLVDRAVKLQAWLKGTRSPFFYLSLLLFSTFSSPFSLLSFSFPSPLPPLSLLLPTYNNTVVLANRDYLVSGFIAFLRRKYGWDLKDEISSKTTTAHSSANYITLQTYSNLNSNKKFAIGGLDGSSSLEILQKPHPLYPT